MAIPIISIVGRTNSGKTTLIERIVSELKLRGYRVGTIKHTAHSNFKIDYEGKDSFRHFQAGSDTVVIHSKERMALIKRLSKSLSLDELVERFFQDVDIVITEGYKAEDKPKIEVFRGTIYSEPLCSDKDNIIALVNDKRLKNCNIPQFGFKDRSRIVDFIEEKFLK